MFVQRLTTWIARLAASVSARQRRPAPGPSPRQPVLTGALGHDHDQRTFSAGSASGRWLDDARRLRPHIMPPAPLQGQRWSGRPAISGPIGGSGKPERAAQLPQLPTRPFPASPAPQQPLPPLPPARTPEPEPAARTQPLPSSPGLPVPAHDEAAVLDQQLQRRLRSLRFLVRHGVYNEGFPAGKEPQQYHFSLGLDPLEGE